MLPTIKFYFDIPDHDCNDYNYCSIEAGYHKNNKLMETQPKEVPMKYWINGDYHRWIQFYEKN